MNELRALKKKTGMPKNTLNIRVFPLLFVFLTRRPLEAVSTEPFSETNRVGVPLQV